MEEQYDWLTGLYTRKFGDEKFVELIGEAEKAGKTFGIIYLDLDNLKKFHDYYGHQLTDDLLCHIAAKLRDFIKGNGFVMRYAGDEFVLLLPDFSEDSTQKLAEELRSEIEQTTFRVEETEIKPLTATLGVAVYPFQGKDRESLLISADEAMIKGKKIYGRNCVVMGNDEKRRTS